MRARKECVYLHFLCVSSSLSLPVGQWVTFSLSLSLTLFSQLPSDVFLPTLGSSSFVDITNSWLGSQACCCVVSAGQHSDSTTKLNNIKTGNQSKALNCVKVLVLIANENIIFEFPHIQIF